MWLDKIREKTYWNRNEMLAGFKRDFQIENLFPRKSYFSMVKDE